MKSYLLNQQIIISSDGSLKFNLNTTHKNKKFIVCLNKDLKDFQKKSYKKSLNTITKLNRITGYRTKLFK